LVARLQRHQGTVMVVDEGEGQSDDGYAGRHQGAARKAGKGEKLSTKRSQKRGRGTVGHEEVMEVDGDEESS